jgi:NAD(P)-dependent dehydrogenase (short-subunit alcohol dehydrogenase family)
MSRMTETKRTALVTGTSSGLGRGVGESLTARGWTVLGTVRTPAADLPFETVECDVTDDDAVAALGAEVLARWGRLDALVNNAGYGLTGPIEEVSAPELRHQLDVNVVGPLALVRACLPALRAARGVVVQVSSVSGYSADGLFGPYNASKFALEGASEALAVEVAGQGVRVVLVEPGPFRTPITAKSPVPAGRGSSGLYEEQWVELDDWSAWHRAHSPDPQPCIDAIVAAATRPDAPLRLPVGDGIADELRRKGAELVAQADAAVDFLGSL